MEEYLPHNNSLLIGHEEQEKLFLEAFLSGKMHHAWILHGPSGIGKATLAYKIARFLISNIGNQDTGFLNEPVTSINLSNTHPTFKLISSQACPDLLVIEREFDAKSGKFKKEITIDNVRKINEFMHKTSSNGNYRVVIVDGADTMNRNSQNAILKVLEEPPAKTIIILTANNIGAFLPTIKSRCRSLKLNSLSKEKIYELLSKFCPKTSDEEHKKIALLSEGSIGNAMQINEQNGLNVYEDLLSLLAKNLNAKQIHKLCEEYGNSKNDKKYQLLTSMLINFLSKKIISIAKQKPIENVSGLENIILAEENIQDLIKIKETIEKIIADTRISNLDRSKALLYIFSSII